MSGSGVVREMTRTRKTEAAYTNEQITRQRVDTLEGETARLQGYVLNELAARLRTLEAIVVRRGFWGRLSWLLRGR